MLIKGRVGGKEKKTCMTPGDSPHAASAETKVEDGDDP